MKKLMRTRTKSEGVQQTGFLTESDPHSRTAYIKFKPFSQECTMLNIQQKLQSFRYTMTNFRSATKSTLSDQPIISRLSSIIKGGKTKRGKKRNLTDMDIQSLSSHNSHAVLDAKLERMKRRSDTISKFIPTQYHEEKQKGEQPANIQVRQDLSQQAIQQENAFFDTMHRPVKSVLLTNFNKNNTYVFSRSKHKVMAQDLEKPRFQPPQQPIVSVNGKFASFSTYFYGSYMKKYKERRRLLSKKSTLAQIVAQ